MGQLKYKQILKYALKMHAKFRDFVAKSRKFETAKYLVALTKVNSSENVQFFGRQSFSHEKYFFSKVIRYYNTFLLLLS